MCFCGFPYLKRLNKTGQPSCFLVFFSPLNVPPCLSRKPRRAESEIPSLPEAGPAGLSFERQCGKINGHLLREPLGHAGLQLRGHAALRPAVCCCRCRVRLHCLLWEDFKPCAAIKISVLTLRLCSPPFFLFPAYDHRLGAFPQKLSDKPCTSALQHLRGEKKKTASLFFFASLLVTCATVNVDETLSPANIYPDESAGRTRALLCLYFLPRHTMVTSQTVPT